ncbi:MAG: Gmad2 immunoglobulin-like domain-containing protein [Patescibacteria group bacterium]
MKTRIAVLLIVLLLVAGGAIYYYEFYNQNLPPNENQNTPVSEITNFEECVAAGNLVMESYPRQCRANDQNFVEYIGNELEKTNLIRIDSPRPNTVVESPLEISGQARGTWYFEASFPVKLLDGNGAEISLNPSYIMTTEDWMTEDFVPFKATLEFIAPTTDTGTLVLEKDNPSGLPEYDDSLIVPVKFR